MGRGWRERSLEYTKPSLSAKEWQGSKCLLEQAGESQFARVNFSPDMKRHTGRLRGRHGNKVSRGDNLNCNTQEGTCAEKRAEVCPWRGVVSTAKIPRVAKRWVKPS